MFSSRIGRLEFLFWCAAPVAVGSVILSIIAFSQGLRNPDFVNGPMHRPLGLVVLVSSVVVLRAAVSRLHDVGWSGWATLLLFVPLVDVLVFLLLLLAPGQKTANTFGERSKFLRGLGKPA
jgi:uncharacterized membrane protein YhaH (DUF805 family)